LSKQSDIDFLPLRDADENDLEGERTNKAAGGKKKGESSGLAKIKTACGGNEKEMTRQQHAQDLRAPAGVLRGFATRLSSSSKKSCEKKTTRREKELKKRSAIS